MIALFWLSPSNENGLSKSSGIFGKRICRVTKADILRDAKLIEDETIAEVQAQQAYISECEKGGGAFYVYFILLLRLTKIT